MDDVPAGQRWVSPRDGMYREPMVGCEGPHGVTLLYPLAMFMG